jgi:phthiocerol/phenolphthiocerol synthesis type-I polyketide synthase E
MRKLQPEGPYLLAGYCLGGTVAFEMAQQLRKQDQEVGLLALLDAYNWEKIDNSFLDDFYFRLQKIWFSLTHFLALDLSAKRAALRRRYKGLSNAGPESDIAECNRRAALNYKPKAYPGRIVHIYPARQYARFRRSDVGWKQLALQGVEEIPLPINPGELLDDGVVGMTASKIRSCIDEVIATSSRKNEFVARAHDASAWNWTPETAPNEFC